MKAKSIEKVNEAIFVLRNFIDLSSELLPYLAELKYAKKLSEDDKIDQQRIIEVFKNYKFDKKISFILIHSTILDTIEKSFNYIIDGKHSKDSSKKQLLEFRKEHHRLKNNWNLIDSN
jgi:hypothetical protein